MPRSLLHKLKCVLPGPCPVEYHLVLLFLALAIPKTGVVHLPQQISEVSAEIKIPQGAHDLTIEGNGAILRAGPKFQGRAILSCKSCRHVVVRNLLIGGNRQAVENRQPMPPSGAEFTQSFTNNGILIEDGEGVTLDNVSLSDIAGFAILVSRSKDVTVRHSAVSNSGGRNQLGRNNTSGGILFEEGCENFRVADSDFKNVLGNAVWTHSRYKSPRNAHGWIERNHFDQIGRDAIQVGHGTEILVAGNQGTRIGYPVEMVDVETGGIPVAIDTAGNVDKTTYRGNQFEEVNGKCIDLDGFHDGLIEENVCINKGKPEDYAFGHFGIVMNNASIEMESHNIRIVNNRMEGMKFGGIFVIGEGHRITGNRLLRLNTAHCNENAAKFGCSALGEPDVLDTGIYLGSHAERPAPAKGNVIEGNEITGWKMKSRCIQAAPGVKLTENTIKDNRCSDE